MRSRRKNSRSASLLAASLAACCLPACREAPKPTPRQRIPERIISIAPNATEIIGALGESSRLVAVCDFCVWPPEVARLPRIGGLFDPGLETILGLRPDLIILRGKNDSIERLCVNNGIDLFCDRTEKFEDIYRNITELGQLLDRRERAEELTNRMRERLQSITDAIAGRRRPRVLMTLARSPDAIASVMTASRGTFVDEMIRTAGGENVFAGLDMDYPTISTEAILVSRPEVIVDAIPELEVTPSLEARIVGQWKAVGSTPAGEDGRIYVLDDDNCYIPSPRIVEIIEKLARLFHPEVSID